MIEPGSMRTRTVGNRSFLEVAGEIDMLNSPSLREAVRSLLDVGGSLPIIDLSRVTYMDSSGLNVLVGAAKRLDPAKLPIVGCSRNLRRLLEVSGLASAFRLFDTVDEALEEGV